ncbi:MAG TPA: PIN domain-containing protein [Candidatus Limnocylindrales bacterium]
MTVFVDTSALYAYLDARDADHEAATRAFASLRQEGRVVHNYILVETEALVRARLGVAASSRFLAELVPVLDVEWVTADLHDIALSSLRTAGRRDLSLVDCVSFEVMRRRHVDTAFAFDDDFATAGFRLIP